MISLLSKHSPLPLPMAEQDPLQLALNFRLFVTSAWPVIEPGTEFVGGWHIDAICEHLEAVANGEIKRLLVNMPPRHCKSSLISVLWPAWCWLSNPSLKWLCASYDLPLATRDNRKCRLLIRSKWFQGLFGRLFQLRRDQNQKENFENNKGGYRIATSVGGGTGRGADILLIDDPHPIEQKKGDLRREDALSWFTDTWSTRLNDQQSGAMVAVGQRVHALDLSGYILEGNTGEAWTHLNLPAEYEPSSPCRTYLLSGNELWADPRCEEGELLWEAKFPRESIEKAKQRHGPLGYSALYGQNPVPPGGYVFKQENERLFTVDARGGLYLLETPGGIRAVPIAACPIQITSDVAAKKKEQADYTVFCVWAITPAKEVLLLAVRRAHLSIPEQVDEGYKIFLACNTDCFQTFWFEDVAYQSGLGQHLALRGVPCLPFRPEADKLVRAGSASIWMGMGNAYFLKGAHWLPAWEKELYTFPKSEHDDQVDNFSMMCIIVRQEQPLEPLDPEIVALLQRNTWY